MNNATEDSLGRAVSPKPPSGRTHGGLVGRARSPSAPQSDDGGFGETALPQRRKLPHDIPNWVKDGAIYFITINCAQRGSNQLAHPAIAEAVEESLLQRQAMHQWWIQLFLIMPDHVHGLISFSRDISMCRVISDWKRYIARHHSIEWQRDFFDHRIRDAASLTEKWHYIRNNPLRKNLITTPDQWPYQWHNGQPRNFHSEGRAVSPKPPSETSTLFISKLSAVGGLGETALPA